MLRHLFISLIAAFALIIAILGICLPMGGLRVIVIITNFFDLMLPILAAGALIVYLWNNCCCKKK